MLLRTIAACSFGQGIAGFGTPTARAPEADYSNPMVWLCRLGRSDACSAPFDATVIAVDVSLQKEPYKAASNPPIDSFYVCPTVSVQPAANSEADWGLHLIDTNPTMGNLLAVIGDETRTYLDATKKK